MFKLGIALVELSESCLVASYHWKLFGGGHWGNLFGNPFNIQPTIKFTERRECAAVGMIYEIYEHHEIH